MLSNVRYYKYCGYGRSFFKEAKGIKNPINVKPGYVFMNVLQDTWLYA